jgi:mercuric ion binding protein
MAGGVAAILASTCCLGPLDMILLGFSGAWIGNLTALEPYRPFFIGVALVALFLALAALSALSLSALAAPTTVILSVPSMDCAVCPITVKTALTKVKGVSRAEVSFDKREAIVTFDDAKTNAAALTQATKDAGYPSVVATVAK